MKMVMGSFNIFLTEKATGKISVLKIGNWLQRCQRHQIFNTASMPVKVLDRRFC